MKVRKAVFTTMTGLAVLAAAVSGFFFKSGAAWAAERVLLVQSYNEGQAYTDAITAGVKEGLTGRGVHLEVYFMDILRRADKEWAAEAGAEAKKKVASFRPQVVIAAGDQAQAFFAKDYVGQKTPQFIFCAVDGGIDTYGFPASNVTGVIRREIFKEAVNLLRRLVGPLKTAVVITDRSPASTLSWERFRRQEVELKIVGVERPITFGQWQSAVLHYRKRAEVLILFHYGALLGGEGEKPVEPREVLAWTLANTKLPILGFSQRSVEDGALLGMTDSGREQGLAAARLVPPLLEGGRAGDLEVVRAQDIRLMINLKTAARLGVAIPKEVLSSAQLVIKK